MLITPIKPKTMASRSAIRARIENRLMPLKTCIAAISRFTLALRVLQDPAADDGARQRANRARKPASRKCVGQPDLLHLVCSDLQFRVRIRLDDGRFMNDLELPRWQRPA